MVERNGDRLTRSALTTLAGAVVPRPLVSAIMSRVYCTTAKIYTEFRVGFLESWSLGTWGLGILEGKSWKGNPGRGISHSLQGSSSHRQRASSRTVASPKHAPGWRGLSNSDIRALQPIGWLCDHLARRSSAAEHRRRGYSSSCREIDQAKRLAAGQKGARRRRRRVGYIISTS
jgi:hypothetical protein